VKKILCFLIFVFFSNCVFATEEIKKFGFHLTNDFEIKNQIIKKMETQTLVIEDDEKQIRNLEISMIDKVYIHKKTGENDFTGAVISGLEVGVYAGNIMGGALLQTGVLAPLVPFVFVGSVIALMIPGAIIGALTSLDETQDLSQMTIQEKRVFLNNLVSQKSN